MMKQNYKLQMLALLVGFGFLNSTNSVKAQFTEFPYTGSTQTYIVPEGVSVIEIEAKGAQGGKGYDDVLAGGAGGLGAEVTGTFLVTSGQILTVLVGEKGQDGEFVGGGGGGTFVWDATTEELLIAAGGGGGAGTTDDGGLAINGIDASADEGGTNGNSISSGAGVDGNGGTVPVIITTWASGGAGWNSNGADGSVHGCSNVSTGGETPLDGGAGGIGGGDDYARADGGFGGGGGGNGRCGAVGGGGGGGYSGGGAGGEVFTDRYNGGGGGGSFNAGTNRSSTEGLGAGNGEVLITVKVQAGLQDIPDEDLAAYPNPTTGEFNIELVGQFNYTLYSLRGEVLQTAAAMNKEKLTLDDLANGIYIIEIRTATASKRIRLVKN